MKQRKLSFLIAAHNEEKIIAKTLNNLISLPYRNYEVILGLDGCTDNTEKIVKEFCRKFNKFRCYKLNFRQGKPAVINSIIKHAKGEIIIINDADWIFSVRNRVQLDKFLSVFDNPKIGGIAESFPVEWDRNKIENGNLGYKMVAYSSYFWLNFQKEKFTYKKNEKENLLYLKEFTMFLTNIFRKNLFKENFTLGDDFERTKDIMAQGYDIVVFNDINMPRMTSTYDRIGLKDMFKQKIRTAQARKQLENIENINVRNYYIPAVWHIFKNSWKLGIDIGFLMCFWIFLTSVATFVSGFKKMGTKEGWKLRVKR